VVIHIDLAPHSDNRLLRVSAVSREYYWRGEQPLAGAESPRTFVFNVSQLPAGDYEIEAEVIGPAGRSRAVIQRHVTIARQRPIATTRDFQLN